MGLEPKKDVVAMTAAEAAKLVAREVPAVDEAGKPVIGKDGKPKTTRIPVKTDEVLAFADKGDHVVVVTKDGRKLHGAK